MMRYVRVAVISARVELQRLEASFFLLAVAFLQPLFVGVTAMYMLRQRPDFEAVYVVVGTGLTGIWSLLLFGGAGALNQERWRGALELLVATPVPLIVILSGKILGNVAVSVISMVASYAIGAWLFGYPIHMNNPPGFTISALMALISLSAMGLLFAPLSVLSPATERFLAALEFPVYILSGFLFPTFLLHEWLRPIGYLLPPYWAAYSLHGTSSGNMGTGDLLLAWSLLLATSITILAIAARLFRLVIARARREGSLSLA